MIKFDCVKSYKGSKVKLSTAEIISLISSVCAAISATMAVITCLLTVRYKKPKIQIDIHQKPQDCYFLNFQKPNGEFVGIAYMAVSIYNASPICGTIGGIEIIFNKKHYSVETINSDYNPDWFSFKETNDMHQDFEKFRLKVPLSIDAFAGTMGFFLIHEPFITNEHEIFVTVKVKLIENKFKVKYYKNIKFEAHNKNSNRYHEHYATEIKNYSLLSGYLKFPLVEKCYVDLSVQYNCTVNPCISYSFEIISNDYLKYE